MSLAACACPCSTNRSRLLRAAGSAVNAKRIVFIEAEQRKAEREPKPAPDLDLAAKEARFADWIRPVAEADRERV